VQLGEIIQSPRTNLKPGGRGKGIEGWFLGRLMLHAPTFSGSGTEVWVRAGAEPVRKGQAGRLMKSCKNSSRMGGLKHPAGGTYRRKRAAVFHGKNEWLQKKKGQIRRNANPHLHRQGRTPYAGRGTGGCGIFSRVSFPVKRAALFQGKPGGFVLYKKMICARDAGQGKACNCPPARS